MKLLKNLAVLVFSVAAFSSAQPTGAAEYPTPKQADWVVRDFRFHTGEVLPELRLHYTTVGDPSGEAVLILHGSAIYQYEGARGYNPATKLETIKARMLAINSADDERNPPELGILEREIKRVKSGRYILVPASEQTRGHGTTGMAKLWKHHRVELLQTSVQAAK